MQKCTTYLRSNKLELYILRKVGYLLVFSNKTRLFFLSHFVA